MYEDRLLVIVSDGHYDMYGVPNLMNRFRAAFLKLLGGVSDTVEPGTYEFRIVRKGLRLYTELYPVK